MTQRQPRKVDPAYLAFVRQQPCCVCFATSHIEAAHIRMACPERDKRSTGMAEKPSDRFCVPLCKRHHREGPDSQHATSERKFWQRHCIDPFAIAECLYAIGGTGGTVRKRVKQPRQPRSKTSWPTGRKLKGRSTWPTSKRRRADSASSCARQP